MRRLSLVRMERGNAIKIMGMDVNESESASAIVFTSLEEESSNVSSRTCLLAEEADPLARMVRRLHRHRILVRAGHL